jgi:hypothetical protein
VFFAATAFLNRTNIPYKGREYFLPFAKQKKCQIFANTRWVRKCLSFANILMPPNFFEIFLPTLTRPTDERIFLIFRGYFSVADPNPRPEAFLTPDPGFGMEKNPYPGSAMNIPDYISRA